MKKFKRIVPLVLAIMLVFGSFGTVFGADSIGDPLIDAFVTEVYSLGTTDREMFVDLLMLFKNSTDKPGLTNSYATAFGALGTAQQARLTSFGATINAFNAFATYIDGVTFTESNLRAYLGLGGAAENQAAFRNAIASEEVAFRTALDTAGADLAKLDAGFSNMTKLFAIMNTIPLQIYDATAVNGTLTVNAARVGTLVAAANVILGDDITGTTELVNALGTFATYYSTSPDKAAIYTYLSDNGFIYLQGTGGGGGTVTPPVVKEPTTQEEVNEAATVQLPATVTQSGSNVNIASTVTPTLLTNALEAAKKAVTDLAPTTSADTKAAQTIIVLEVPAQTGAPVTNVQVSVPLVPLQNAEKDGAQAILIKTELGQVTFDTQSLLPGSAEVSANDTIVLEINKVDQAALANTDVPAGALVLDFALKINDEKVTEFHKPIRVAVPYTLKTGDNPEQITVYFLNDNGVSAPVGGRYNSETGMVEFYTEHFSKYYATITSKSFNDVLAGFWAKDFIDNLAAKGFINGKTSTTFAPQDNITRAEFVAIVSRMYRLAGNVSGLKFEDVSATDWFAKDVAGAFQAGIISGRSDTAFDPHATITRQEMAVVIANTLSYLGYEKADSYTLSDKFVDAAQIATWATEAVARSYKQEIINGKPGKVFDPIAPATRAETAKMLYVLYYLP